MLDVLSITFPIYAAIAIGYATVRFGLFGRVEMRALGSFVMTLALPALLFTAVARRDPGEVFNLTYMAVSATGGLLTAAVVYAWFTLTRDTASRRAIAVMGATCPNSGFVGYPVLLLTMPELAGPVLAMNFLVENLLIIPLSLALLEATRGSARLTAIFLRVLRQPMILGLGAGLVVSASGVSLPGPAIRVADMFAAAASALSLVVIGGTLAALPKRGHWSAALRIGTAKLALHPALVALALAALLALGLPPMDRQLTAALVLSAAMPMFGIYTVFAQAYGEEESAALTQVAATVAAFFTLAALLAKLG